MGILKFPGDFLWGAAASAYQIEGAVTEDGRGESIWDRFSYTPGKVLHGDTGDVACDHYHRFRQDIRIMKELGLKAYRFSIAWPRIFPEGKGKINTRGVGFYQALVEELLQNGIEPMATLYHWDLPQALEDKGGWRSRDTMEYFAEYSDSMYRTLGDRVKLWITHNEPLSVAYLGYATGEYAPGYTDHTVSAQVSHHILLSHAKAVQAFRQSGLKDAKIGIVLYFSDIHPASSSNEDRETAKLVDGIYNRWFLDPVMKGEYPQDVLEFFRRNFHSPLIEPEDMRMMKDYPVDFLGVNYYTRTVVKASSLPGPMGYETVLPVDSEYTHSGWEIYPQGLYHMLMRIHRDYGSPLMYITENGAAFRDDRTADGEVQDEDRIDYLKRHLEEIHRAVGDGAGVKGYFLWSLLDNFEWSHGYSQRFGIVHVNYDTLERTLKKSARWYKDVISRNGL